LFGFFISVDIVMVAVVLMHIFMPLISVKTAVAFLGVLPAVAFLAPVWALLAILLGSVPMLKTYSAMNTCLIFFNYPLTIFALLFFK
jgi:hypothetical protein